MRTVRAAGPHDPTYVGCRRQRLLRTTAGTSGAALSTTTLGVTPAQASTLAGREFFPQLISGPFAHGLTPALGFAAAACLVAAVASVLRGGRYHWSEPDPAPRAAANV
ncbi:MAG: hypothetical protein ABT15_02810 [Pseudonocardia sp. SCN 73-27]|uniref:hypothetical protein n=1 Tax=Pseudonocardia sp. TaxID=60912 RepID=UPI00086B95F7|nr:MAG: hypothetical protein ABS80_00365 [Pseudonocardia sp. SCN 72-51]ODV08756.1 MAG: hypothetical protein ABT15_02810 [Pseudonocardia sp. SCN 73-27]